MQKIEQLHTTLKQRKRPEDVAQLILELDAELFTLQEKAVLKKAAGNSLKKQLWQYTSMAQTFATASGAGKQMAKAAELFHLEMPSDTEGREYASIEAYIARVSPLLQKEVGQNNFRTDRLNKAQRKEKGIDLSKRAYNKRWRLLKRLEKKLLTFAQQLRKNEFQQIAKHGLAHHIPFDEFSKDISTACFIAYYTARCNLRSEFTVSGQTRPYDEISDMLFRKCTGEPADVDTKSIWDIFKIQKQNPPTKEPVPATPNWWAMAHVYASPRVMQHLTDEQKGVLLGRWTSILQDISSLLQQTWQQNEINRQTMVVKRGNDSSTWNNTAGAWNKSRDHWMNLVYATGMDHLLDELCFGKVLRLIAGDVAYWHRQVGHAVEPNTVVWNALPLPWEVFEGKATCTLEMVRAACKKAGINPEKTGWIAPREHSVVPFTPTPELVHGVSISNPFLAEVLKKHRYFSGKPINPIFPTHN